MDPPSLIYIKGCFNCTRRNPIECSGAKDPAYVCDQWTNEPFNWPLSSGPRKIVNKMVNKKLAEAEIARKGVQHATRQNLKKAGGCLETTKLRRTFEAFDIKLMELESKFEDTIEEVSSLEDRLDSLEMRLHNLESNMMDYL